MSKAQIDWQADWARAHGRLDGMTLVERLHDGGHARLFRALRPTSAGEQRVVAVKVPLPHLQRDENFMAAFAQECQLLAALGGRACPRVVDCRTATPQPYLAMDYFPQGSLGRLGNAALAPEPLADLCALLVESLSELHSFRLFGQELVHADLGRENLLWSRERGIVIADFGLARMLPEIDDAASHFRASCQPSLDAQSPEHARGEALSQATDVFAAAKLLCELALGAPIFDQSSRFAYLLDAQTPRPASLAKRLTDYLGQQLGSLLYACLSPDPSARPANASRLQRELPARDPAQARQQVDRALRRKPLTQGQLATTDARHTPVLLASVLPQTRPMAPLMEAYFVDGSAEPQRFAQVVEALGLGHLNPQTPLKRGHAPSKPLASFGEFSPWLVATQTRRTAPDLPDENDAATPPGTRIATAMTRLDLEGLSGLFQLRDTRLETTVLARIEGGFVTGVHAAGLETALLDELAQRDLLDDATRDTLESLAEGFGGSRFVALIESQLVLPAKVFELSWGLCFQAMLHCGRWQSLHISFDESPIAQRALVETRLSLWQLAGRLVSCPMKGGDTSATTFDVAPALKLRSNDQRLPRELRQALKQLIQATPASVQGDPGVQWWLPRLERMGWVKPAGRPDGDAKPR